jgi:hypothetical protein
MDVRLREVPEQVVVSEQRMVDQQALEQWLPGAMSRVHKAAGAGADQHICDVAVPFARSG